MIIQYTLFRKHFSNNIFKKKITETILKKEEDVFQKCPPNLKNYKSYLNDLFHDTAALQAWIFRQHHKDLIINQPIINQPINQSTNQQINQSTTNQSTNQITSFFYTSDRSNRIKSDI